MIVAGITCILTKCGLVTSMRAVLKFFKFLKFYAIRCESFSLRADKSVYGHSFCFFFNIETKLKKLM